METLLDVAEIHGKLLFFLFLSLLCTIRTIAKPMDMPWEQIAREKVIFLKEIINSFINTLNVSPS